MRVVFRVDASLEMGTGHVMRCLTLAKALKKQNICVFFICQHLDGDLIRTICSENIIVYSFNETNYPVLEDSDSSVDCLAHSKWLPKGQNYDLSQSLPIIELLKPDWVVVDHYAIDSFWEARVKSQVKFLMVIDDLADRQHCCDLLLDQNLGTSVQDYFMTHDQALKLIGTTFCLLRPEFEQLRKCSLDRRKNLKLERLLISLGGVDAKGHIVQVLKTLQPLDFPSDFKITVVVGSNTPHLSAINEQLKSFSCQTKLILDASNMAEIMANSDLAIGAAGSSAWERCCLGLPTLQMVTADNQKKIAQALSQCGAVLTVQNPQEIANTLNLAKKSLLSLSDNTQRIVDGKGVNRVVNTLMAMSNMINFLSPSMINLCQVVNYTCLTSQEKLEVLQLRNHPEVRKWMFQPNKIKLSEHMSFIDSLKEREDCQYLLVKCWGVIVGTINFQYIDNSTCNAEFGLYANPFFPVKGRGVLLERLASLYAKKTLGLETLSLVVFEKNQRALNVYYKQGFIEVGKTQKSDQTLVKMTKSL